MRIVGLVTLIVGVTLVVGRAMAAEPRDPVAAEALFAAGKDLMDKGDFRQACPKLEESYRLDPATGALYALALCHERQGRLATAWAEFLDAAARSSAEGNAAREEAAKKHAEALEPRLSFLIVRVDPATARVSGLVITRNGVVLRPAGWGTPVPIDPGSHVLRAVAPGHAPWEATLTIGQKRQREVVEVPELTRGAPPTAKQRDAVRPAPWMEITPLQFTGIALGGAGVASLGIAALASVRALNKNADSNAGLPDHCDGNTCGPEGEKERMSAREAANFATIGAIAGGVLLGAGVVLFVVGGEGKNQPKSGKVSTSLGPGGARVHGDF